MYLDSTLDGQVVESADRAEAIDVVFRALTTWRKSTYSGGNGSNCVEVGRAESAVLVRDTQDRAGAALTFGPAAWRQFAARIKDPDKA